MSHKARLIIGPINIHIHPPRPDHDELLFDVGPEFDIPRLSKSQNLLEGFFVAYQLKDNKGLHLKLQGMSRHGNPVDFTNEEVTAVSSDTTILTVTEDTGIITIVPVGPLNTAQVQVTIPGVLIGGVPLGGTFDVQVIAGDALTIAMTPADTFDLPPDPTAAPTVPAGTGTGP